jgi:DNA invertase Pin-like site-specific DNA recombinase
MMDGSRLGREQTQTSYLLTQIIDAGVRVFSYLEDRERKLETALDKMIDTLNNFAVEVEREKAKQRTRDAYLARARKGQVTGRVVYGYRNVPVHLGNDPSGNPLHSHVRREIEAAEAEPVRASSVCMPTATP